MTFEQIVPKSQRNILKEKNIFLFSDSSGTIRRIERPCQTKFIEKPACSVANYEKYPNLENYSLKFNAYWDDRESRCGDLHDLVLYYFLSDGTIQINEIPQSTGKPAKPVVLYKRLRLPKVTYYLINGLYSILNSQTETETLSRIF